TQASRPKGNSEGPRTLRTTAGGQLVWSTGESTASITVNSAGPDSVTATVYGCTRSAGTAHAAPKPPPNAGTNGTLTICEGTTVTETQLFAELGGTPDTGGTWSPALAGAGTYTYTVSATSSCTSEATSEVVVT
ncbi:hypothetical protein CSC81_15760, partial [Tenacibaculum discolor]